MVQTWKNPEVFFHPGGPHPFLSVAVFQGWCLSVLLRAWMGAIEFPGKDDGRRRWGYVHLRPWHPFWKPTKWKGNQHIPTLVLGARNVTFKKAVSRKEILYLARFDSWYLTWALLGLRLLQLASSPQCALIQTCFGNWGTDPPLACAFIIVI